MKKIWLIGLCGLLLTSCLREHYDAKDCRVNLYFKMQDVPYVFDGEEVVDYQPYYFFVEQLDLFLFADRTISTSYRYDYQYCREHLVIPVVTEIEPQWYLFVANLYDPKELNWTFQDGKLKAWFSIVDYEEPPVLLAATAALAPSTDSVKVNLLMMVSRLEIQITNPPAWVSGLNVNVRDIAATVSTDFLLGDTTHINKRIWFDNHGPGNYWFGVNTFPTYQNRAAFLSIDLLGTSEAAPILVEDERLHLVPGVITRLNIQFETEEKIIISVEVDGKWEVIDEGNIII